MFHDKKVFYIKTVKLPCFSWTLPKIVYHLKFQQRSPIKGNQGTVSMKVFILKARASFFSHLHWYRRAH